MVQNQSEQESTDHQRFFLYQAVIKRKIKDFSEGDWKVPNAPKSGKTGGIYFQIAAYIFFFDQISDRVILSLNFYVFFDQIFGEVTEV